MTVLAFSMNGDPRAKGRPKGTAKRGFVRFYTDDKTRTYEASIASIAREMMAGRAPFVGPISFSMKIRLPVPKSMSKRQRARVLSGEEAYFGTIDWDNAAKSVNDAFNGVVWVDDIQVTRAFVTKTASEVGGLDIRVEAYQPQGSL